MPSAAFYQVDAFTDIPFRGNPAAVVILEAWPDESWLQQIAAENNLSETAFAVGEAGRYELRWFTPAVEVDLCGHATLATAHALYTETEERAAALAFETRSGRLMVSRVDQGYQLDFPAFPPTAVAFDSAIASALGGAQVEAVLMAKDMVVVLPSANAVRDVAPDMAQLAALPARGVAVTARGSGRDADVDFVSRFFAPSEGIPEDPVTGSAHCSLAPYWGGRLGKHVLAARQVSAREGNVRCELAGQRVLLWGQAVTVIRGRLDLGR